MDTRLLALAGALLLAPGATLAQTRIPTGLAARAVALQQGCQAGGGRVANGDRAFVHNADLNGDGVAEFIMDEAGFACSNRAVTQVTASGAPLEVFDGATGQSLYRGLAYTFALQPAPPRNVLVVTLRGPACGAGATATTACQRPLTWNASSRSLTGAPTIAAATPTATQAQAAPSPAVGAGAATSMTLNDADKAAAFRAVGFRQMGGAWKRCVEDPAPSYRGGRLEEVLDLNGDGRPEAVIAENSSFCHGQQGDWFGVVTKEANGSWRPVLEIDGVFVARETRANGWREIEIGGPGTQGFPIWRYNGKQYVYNRGP